MGSARAVVIRALALAAGKKGLMDRQPRCRSVIAWLGATGLLLQASFTPAQGVADAPATVSVGSMPEAMDTLIERYGYVITLETPPYVYEDDLQDERALRSDLDLDRLPKTGGPIWAAKGVSLTLTLPPAGSVARAVDMWTVMKQLAREAAKSDHGAHWRVEQQGDVFHLIPTEVRDASGKWVAQTPLLDTPVSLPSAERSLLGSLQAVCSQLEGPAHARVGLLQYPLNTLHYTRSVVGAKQETARSVITKILGSTGTSFAWRIFYDIPMNAYLLSVLVVPSNSGDSVAKRSSPNTATHPNVAYVRSLGAGL
jgi:hypothetical protein